MSSHLLHGVSSINESELDLAGLAGRVEVSGNHAPCVSIFV